MHHSGIAGFELANRRPAPDIEGFKEIIYKMKGLSVNRYVIALRF